MRKPTLRIWQLHVDVAWFVDNVRIYICRFPSLAETGLPLYGLPPSLLSLVLSQLEVGTTQRDLAFLLGLGHMRRVVRVLRDLKQRDLLIQREMHWQIVVEENHERVEFASQATLAVLQLPAHCQLLWQSGSAMCYPLPASIARESRADIVVHDIAIGGGQLVLARRREAEICFACLLLWFFGSRVMPYTYLGAALNRRAPADVGKEERLQRAVALLEQDVAGILFFPLAETVQVEEDRPLGCHPACGCTRFARRIHAKKASTAADLGIEEAA